jgi:hypothetical protein
LQAVKISFILFLSKGIFFMADAANAPSYSTPQTFQTRNRLFKWVLNGTSTGVPIRVADLPDKTVQGFGTWGSATLVWEGTNDERGDPTHADYANAEFGTLTDTTETNLSQTDDTAPQQVLQNPVWIRPKTTGGTSTTVNAMLNAGKN